MSVQPTTLPTASEYFQHDHDSAHKLEYFYGTIVAKAGATARHNMIVTNVIGHLFPHLRQHGCRIYPGDLRVQAISHHIYTYPDLTIVCGSPQFLEPSELTLVNPILYYGDSLTVHGCEGPQRKTHLLPLD